MDLYGLLGVQYLTDSLMYAMNTRRQDEAYRVYVTDCFYGICSTLGGKLERRYYDILHPAQEETRSGEEIAYERLERFGIEVVD